MKSESPEHYTNGTPEYSLSDDDICEIRIALMDGHEPDEWMEAYGDAYDNIVENDPEIIKLCYGDREACIDAIREKLIRGLH